MLPIPQINSRDNQKVKFARAVRQNRENSFIFIEGARLASELIQTNLKIKFGFITENFLRNFQLIKILAEKKVDLNILEDRLFASLADTKNSQGIILVADRPETGQNIIEARLSASPFLLLLHKLNNPANLGSITRTAEAGGIDGIITTKGTTDVFSPKALRGGMGANLRIPFWLNTDFSEIIRWAKIHKIKTVCADLKSKKSYLEINWQEPRLLIIGSEGHGLTVAEQKMTEENLVIPMDNQVESLNAAVAAGIIVFEAKRQRAISR